MTLSALQKYILRMSYVSRKGRIPRTVFNAFYQRRTLPASMTDSITASLERLIDRGLMIGYGRRTPKKWFIEEVKLTSAGRRAGHAALGHQQKLPLR